MEKNTTYMRNVMAQVKRSALLGLTAILAVAMLALALGDASRGAGSGGGTSESSSLALNEERQEETVELDNAELIGIRDGNTCAQAARVVWEWRHVKWPPAWVIAAGGMALACGYQIGTVWSERAQRAWNTCWPNCPWWYAFRFW